MSHMGSYPPCEQSYTRITFFQEVTFHRSFASFPLVLFSLESSLRNPWALLLRMIPKRLL
jgi:hypothetical protein